MGFTKSGGTGDQIANICWIMKKAGNSRKASTFASLTTLKPLTMWIITNWKILKDTGVPGHLSRLLRHLYAGQEETEPNMKQLMSSKSEKEYIKAVYCHPAYLFNLHADYIM